MEEKKKSGERDLKKKRNGYCWLINQCCAQHVLDGARNTTSTKKTLYGTPISYTINRKKFDKNNKEGYRSTKRVPYFNIWPHNTM